MHASLDTEELWGIRLNLKNKMSKAFHISRTKTHTRIRSTESSSKENIVIILEFNYLDFFPPFTSSLVEHSPFIAPPQLGL